MDVYEAIRTRRSVRSYRPDAIPKEVLHRVLDAARVAPSAGNGQPTRMIVVTKPEARQKLAEMCGKQEFIAEAPVVIVACGLRMNLTSGAHSGESDHAFRSKVTARSG
jgi:nitroreductase